MQGTGRVFQRGKVWWIAFSYNGKEYRESSRSRKRADARRLLKTRLAEIITDKFAPGQGRLTVGEVIDNLIRSHELRGKKGVKVLRYQTKAIREFMGNDRVGDLTSEKIRRYQEHCLAEGKAPATINREVGNLLTALRLAQKEKLISSVPYVQRLDVHNARQGFLEPAQLDRLLRCLPDDGLRDFVEFAAMSGWRKAGIANLAWGDVDLKDRTLQLRPEHSKNSEPCLIALEGDLLELIRRRDERRTYRLPDGTIAVSSLVFHRGGERVYEFRKSWRTATVKAGLPGLLFHDLRRSAVRNMIRAGVGEKTTMKLIGHKTASMLWRYNIVDDRDLREAVVRTQRYVKTKKRNASS